MILVDTSVWIDHFRRGDPTLVAALEDDQVLMHPFVLGEIASGNLSHRSELLALLGEIPEAPIATVGEVLDFIERRKLMGRGIGYVDVHLLASVTLAQAAALWTRDKALAHIAAGLGCAFSECRGFVDTNGRRITKAATRRRGES